MVILSVENISKTLKDGPLFQEVSFGMECSARWGLVGPNGAGKSTFLRVIKGELASDTGTIARARNLTVSLLGQETRFTPGETVENFLLSGDHPVLESLREHRAVLASCTRGLDGAESRLHVLMEELENNGGWEVPGRYASLLDELRGPDLSDPMEILSGGMRKKVAIARVLACAPDLLLLDEPTNHLDISAIEWLENYLVSSRQSVIMVTHDRYLLNRVCDTILELDQKRMYFSPGSYAEFLKRREERLSARQQEQERLRTVLRQELAWLNRGPKARTGKDSGRKARIEAMQDSLTVPVRGMAAFASAHRRMGRKILELTDVSKSYGNALAVGSFSHSFTNGERIGLVGPNGSGKTTLLDMIAGRTEPDSGMIDVGVNTVFGYYDQLDSHMNLRMTVLEYITGIAEEIAIGPGQTISAARFLELFGFPVSFHRITIGLLSGGERRRLHLVGVLMGNPNFLLMDEPTNDLDIETIRRLEEYLLDFQGCVLIVSHDRAFLDGTTDTLFVFDDSGAVTEFAGTFSDFRNAAKDNVTIQASDAGKKPGKSGKGQIKIARRVQKPGLTFKEQRELDTILDEIDTLEKEVASLERSFAAANVDVGTLAERMSRYREIGRLLETRIARWEDLASRDARTITS